MGRSDFCLLGNCNSGRLCRSDRIRGMRSSDRAILTRDYYSINYRDGTMQDDFLFPPTHLRRQHSLLEGLGTGIPVNVSATPCNPLASGTPIPREVFPYLLFLISRGTWLYVVHLSCSSSAARARTFKCLWGPRIDSKERIPPAYVAWRAGAKTLFFLGA